MANVGSRTEASTGMGPRKSVIVMVTVVGCIAILWPKVFSPMMAGNGPVKSNIIKDHRGGGCCGVVLDQETFANQTINVETHQAFRKNLNIMAAETSSIRQERPPHLRSEPMHPAMRERGRAIPHTQTVPIVDRGHAPPSAARIIEGRPGPIPGMRPPMGAGSHQAAKTTNSMGFIMPLYTIGIVSFFIYTIMKLIFKKPQSLPYDEVKPDPAFRQEVFTQEKPFIKRPDDGTTKLEPSQNGAHQQNGGQVPVSAPVVEEVCVKKHVRVITEEAPATETKVITTEIDTESVVNDAVIVTSEEDLVVVTNELVTDKVEEVLSPVEEVIVKASGTAYEETHVVRNIPIVMEVDEPVSEPTIIEEKQSVQDLKTIASQVVEEVENEVVAVVVEPISQVPDSVDFPIVEEIITLPQVICPVTADLPAENSGIDTVDHAEKVEEIAPIVSEPTETVVEAVPIPVLEEKVMEKAAIVLETMSEAVKAEEVYAKVDLVLEPTVEEPIVVKEVPIVESDVSIVELPAQIIKSVQEVVEVVKEVSVVSNQSISIAETSVEIAETLVPIVDSTVPIIEASIGNVETLVPIIKPSAPIVETSVPTTESAAPIVEVSATVLEVPSVEIPVQINESSSSIIESPAQIIEKTVPQQAVESSVSIVETSVTADESSLQLVEKSDPIADSITETEAPIVESSAPFVEASVLNVDSSVPIIETTATTIDASVSIIESSKPIVESLVPIVETSVPITESAAPIVEVSATVLEVPSVEIPVQIIETSSSVIETRARIIETTVPQQAVESSVSIVETSVTAVESSLPLVETSAPIVDSIKETEALIVKSSAPFVEASVQNVDTSVPIIETAAPTISASVPIIESSIPIVASSVPIVETSVPAVESSVPIEASVPVIEPSVETSVSVPIIEAPIQIIESSVSIIEQSVPIVDSTISTVESVQIKEIIETTHETIAEQSQLIEPVHEPIVEDTNTNVFDDVSIPVVEPIDVKEVQKTPIAVETSESVVEQVVLEETPVKTVDEHLSIIAQIEEKSVEEPSQTIVPSQEITEDQSIVIAEEDSEPITIIENTYLKPTVAAEPSQETVDAHQESTLKPQVITSSAIDFEDITSAVEQPLSIIEVVQQKVEEKIPQCIEEPTPVIEKIVVEEKGILSTLQETSKSTAENLVPVEYAAVLDSNAQGTTESTIVLKETSESVEVSTPVPNKTPAPMIETPEPIVEKLILKETVEISASVPEPTVEKTIVQETVEVSVPVVEESISKQVTDVFESAPTVEVSFQKETVVETKPNVFEATAFEKVTETLIEQPRPVSNNQHVKEMVEIVTLILEPEVVEEKKLHITETSIQLENVPEPLVSSIAIESKPEISSMQTEVDAIKKVIESVSESLNVTSEVVSDIADAVDKVIEEAVAASAAKIDTVAEKPVPFTRKLEFDDYMIPSSSKSKPADSMESVFNKDTIRIKLTSNQSLNFLIDNNTDTTIPTMDPNLSESDQLLELDLLRLKLDETERAMSKIIAKMGTLPIKGQETIDENVTSNGHVKSAEGSQNQNQSEKVVNKKRDASIEREKGTVKVMGMEMTATHEGGKRRSRPATPNMNSSRLEPPTIEDDAPEPQSIYLQGALPHESQILVTDSETNVESLAGDEEYDEDEAPVVLSGKMTLSLINLDHIEKDALVEKESKQNGEFKSSKDNHEADHSVNEE